MADPVTQALGSHPEAASGAPIPFRFEVTWRSLTRPLTPAAPRPAAALLPARRPPPRDTEAKEWEMVLPRMRRPAALSPAPAALAAVESQDGPVAAPSFGVELGRAPSRRWLLIAGPPLLAAAALAFYFSGRQSAPAAPAAMEMGGAGWITEWASGGAGSARGRQIALYRPSMSMSDYRLEFAGRIERKSLGWVFRARDSRNYYAGKLEASSPQSPLTLTRFAVIDGREGLHFQRVLAHAPGQLKVRLDARGPRFTVYLQNQIVEDWQDDRLKSGGVGFLNERDERGQVGAIQISFLKGGVR